MEMAPLHWIMEVPPVTRTIVLGMIGFATLASMGFIQQSDCYYSFDTVFKKFQFYRLISSFLYVGQFDSDLFFNLFMLVRHSQSLENGFVRSRDYIWMLFIICTSILCYNAYFMNKILLNSQFNDALNYIWARKNPNTQLVLLGLVTFDAIYLPYVHAGAVAFQEPIHKSLSGLIVGHVLFFLMDTFPKLHNGFQPLAPIWEWGKHLENHDVEEPLGEDAAPIIQDEGQLEEIMHHMNERVGAGQVDMADHELQQRNPRLVNDDNEGNEN